MTAAAVAARERPVLMSGPMVRAILDGLKTQTRRVVKPQPSALHGLMPMWGRSPDGVDFGDKWLWREVGADYPDDASDDRLCPFGVPGDRLWVREAHRYRHESDWIAAEGSEAEDVLVDQEHVRYELDLRIGVRRDRERGDLVERVTYLDESTPIEDDNWLRTYKRRPSIHMPRWACRITLEITNVRVERLQAITNDDALAEGVKAWGPLGVQPETNTLCQSPRDAYRRLWDSLNAKRGYGWGTSPWVWVIEFKRAAP